MVRSAGYWTSVPFLAACEVGKQYGIAFATDLSMYGDLLDGYLACRVAGRRPVVVDWQGRIVWDGRR